LLLFSSLLMKSIYFLLHQQNLHNLMLKVMLFLIPFYLSFLFYQFLLEDVEGMTKLSVRHYGFEEGSKMFGLVSNGWAIVLAGLKTLLETGKPINLKARA